MGALTAGYVIESVNAPGARVGIGGDITVYHVPQNLLDNYGAPASFHVFLRYRPGRPPSHTVHH